MSPPRLPPIAAIASAPGRGAVGVVRISGPDLTAFASALCGRSLRARHAHYLTFRDHAGQPLDQGLALFFPAPHSYTGEDVLELQAHGGPLVLQLLLARCLEVAAQIDPVSGGAYAPGLRLARAGEFSERAFLNGKLDLAQAESVADLIAASTEGAARGAARSLAGEFSQAVEGLSASLVQLRTLVEATLDFPEEEIDFLQQADAQGQLQWLQEKLGQVQAQARQGALLREGLRVVIAGQPNVGKSSLLNALAQAEVAIVTEVPGTTRDVLRETLAIDGVPLQAIDTAGLRASQDPVERIGMARAWEQMTIADVLLHVRDLTRAGATEYIAADAQLVSEIAEKLPTSVARITVWNKADAAPSHAFAENANASALFISAKTGAGLGQLRQRLLQAAGWQAPEGGVFSARQRHLHALALAAEHLQSAAAHLDSAAPALELMAEELRLAHQALMQITGAFGVEDLLGEIFGRFCIGK